MTERVASSQYDGDDLNFLNPVSCPDNGVAMIRFGGHLPKGEYDVDHDGHAGQADAAELHG